MKLEAIHIFFPPLVGVGLTIGSFTLDHLVADRLRKYFLKRQVADALSDRIVLIAKSIALLVTYYTNIIILFTNLLLAFVVFPISYGYWVVIIDLVVILAIVTEIGWLWQYEAIDVTDDLPALRLPLLGIVSVELWLRSVQIAFNVFTFIYFFVGYRLSESG